MKQQSVVIYESGDGQVGLDVELKDDTVWLTQKQLCELFDRDKSVISRHINNIFKSGELSKAATVAFFATVQTEGKREVIREVEYYNLDMIISLGYRVNSQRATQFRIWATNVLKDHLIKGYSVNQVRHNNMVSFTDQQPDPDTEQHVRPHQPPAHRMTIQKTRVPARFRISLKYYLLLSMLLYARNISLFREKLNENNQF